MSQSSSDQSVNDQSDAGSEPLLPSEALSSPINDSQLASPGPANSSPLDEAAAESEFDQARPSDLGEPLRDNELVPSDFASNSIDAEKDFVDERAAAPLEAELRVDSNVDLAWRAQRILPVPVTVSVLLAERKMPVGQVAGLVPGALITFNKSCEDLLDLFVNNHRHCQGEAVKIGEHFGLKVVRVGVQETRKEHVL